ncbi:MAG TPA: MFS transporter [Phycisphaerae bacterium]|nr:MFS transporter [Phycisphaerae bacterium]
MSLRHRSYELLPALSVRKAELRRSLRLVTAAWGFGIIWMTCLSGSWMNSFQRMLGFNDFHFGLYQALPFLATFANLASTIFIERTGLRKHLFIAVVGVARMLWVLVAAILLLMAGTAAAKWLVLATLMVIGTLSALGMPAWFTWMGDLIPRRIRGRFLARRQQVTRLLQFPVAITLAIVIDHVIDRSLPFTPEAQPRLLWALAGLFAAAAVFGTIDVLIFLRIREVRPTTPDEPRRPAVEIRVAPADRRGPLAAIGHAGRYLVAVVRQLLIEPMKDRVFRRYVLFGQTATFAMAVGGPFYIRNMRENLGFSHIAVSVIFMILGPLLSILAVKQWGKLIDRWGRRPTLMVAMALAAFGAVPYFFASRFTPDPPFVADAVNWLSRHAGRLVGQGNWQLIPPGAPVGAWMICSATIFFGFVGWSGVMLGQQGIILGFSDSHGRSKYVAAHAVLLGVGGMVGGVVGGLLARTIAQASWYHPVQLGAYLEWNHWHATFAMSTLARLAAFLLLIGMPDPGARRTRDMIRTLGGEMIHFATARLFYPWRLLRPRRRSR